MKRMLVLLVVLSVLGATLMGCTPGGGATPTPASVVPAVDTPTAEVPVVETPTEAAPEATVEGGDVMTDTMEMTETPVMTDTEPITDTTDITDTDIVTP